MLTYNCQHCGRQVTIRANQIAKASILDPCGCQKIARPEAGQTVEPTRKPLK